MGNKESSLTIKFGTCNHFQPAQNRTVFGDNFNYPKLWVCPDFPPRCCWCCVGCGWWVVPIWFISLHPSELIFLVNQLHFVNARELCKMKKFESQIGIYVYFREYLNKFLHFINSNMDEYPREKYSTKAGRSENHNLFTTPGRNTSKEHQYKYFSYGIEADSIIETWKGIKWLEVVILFLIISRILSSWNVPSSIQGLVVMIQCIYPHWRYISEGKKSF